MESLPCSEQARRLAEPLWATAPLTHAFILIEWGGTWEKKAAASLPLPERVRAHLQSWEAALPDSRTLLIKRDPRQARAGGRVYLAFPDDPPRLYRFDYAAWEDLLALDAAALLRQPEAAPPAQPAAETLFLVCTNGRRDPCCAKNGLPVYAALEAAAPATTWQCTHMGGHRFAALTLVLPQGLYYGQMTPQAAAALPERTRRGELDLDHWRGCSRHPAPAQAADYLLRRARGRSRLDDLALLDLQEGAAQTFQVRLLDRPSRQVCRVTVQRREGPEMTYQSCGQPSDAPLVRYALTRPIEVEAGA